MNFMQKMAAQLLSADKVRGAIAKIVRGIADQEQVDKNEVRLAIQFEGEDLTVQVFVNGQFLKRLEDKEIENLITG